MTSINTIITSDRTYGETDTAHWNIVDKADWNIPGGIMTLQQDETFVPSGKVCQPEKHFCSYCQSNSIDDMRGNCCCCGAPRGNDKSHFRYAMNDGLASAEWVRQNFLGLEVAVDGVSASGSAMVSWRI